MVSRLLLLPVWSIRLRQMPIGWRLVAVVQPTSGCKAAVSWDLRGVEKVTDPLPNDEAYDAEQQHDSYKKE
jgi:hypothetical protein